MDMRKVVEDRLRNLAKDEASLERMREEIRSLEAERGAIRAARTDGNPVSGGGNGRSEWLDSNIQQRTYLEARIETVQQRVASTRAALDMLTEEQRKVLDVFFIHRRPRPAEYLEEILKLEYASIYRRKTLAIRDLTRIMYGGEDL